MAIAACQLLRTDLRTNIIVFAKTRKRVHTNAIQLNTKFILGLQEKGGLLILGRLQSLLSRTAIVKTFANV